VKLFSLKNFALSLSEAPKRIIFVFCYSFNILLSSKNQIRLLCQTPNVFSTVKRALCVQSLCLLLHSNFLVFSISDSLTAEKVRIICGRCQITIPGHLRVYRCPSMLQRVHSISYSPVLKTKRSGGTTGKCSL